MRKYYLILANPYHNVAIMKNYSFICEKYCRIIILYRQLRGVYVLLNVWFMFMSKKMSAILLCLFISIGVAIAQNRTVSGSVTDVTNGEPVAGAAVQLKGSASNYALTDDSGNYSISVPSNGTLSVSCLGYLPTEIPVGGKSVVNITLQPDTQTLNDVIVVAYGTVRREANTGSVSSVKNEQLAQAPATSVDKMLAGKMAGVSITSGSGQPGSTSTIRVRGTSSINAGNEPLWVVDGIPVLAEDFRQLSAVGVGGGSSSTFINPNDIESITVLKDAAATSVYGSRAANGVILVTTKSGKSGKAKFTARAKYGVQQLINDNNIRPLTGTELLDYRRVCAVNAGYDPDDPSSSYYYPYSLLKDGTTNWYKELTRLGTLQEYEVNATGGNNKGSYYSSLSYHNNEGVYYGQDFKRFTARVNADYKLTSSLSTGARINASYSNSNSGQMGALYYSNPQFSMFTILPWTKMYNSDGSFNVNIPENSDTNPRAVAEYDEYNDKDYRLNGTMFLEWRPVKNVALKTTDGVEYVAEYSRQYWNPYTHKDVATLFNIWTKDIRYTTSNTATYDNQVGEHNFHVVLGQEAFIDTYDYIYGYSPKVDPQIPYPTTSTAADDQIDYSYNERTLLSFFGIANYNFADKYFLSASVRRDGSSVFGSDNRWGTFWSVGGSWNIAKERFMSNSSSWLSLLKLRLSYGVNGNDNIAAYRAYGTYSTATYNNFVGMSPSRPANPNLSWEKNKSWNTGLDFGFLEDRITGSVDLYNRITDDMLLSKQVPYTTGFATNFVNIGSIRNRGLEFQIEGVLLRNNDWNWTVGFNVAFNRSKVLDLGGSEFLVASDSRDGNGTSTRIVEGKSLYTFYLRDWYGVNPSTGDGLWWTKDGKLTSDAAKAQYIYTGSPEPKATGGFNTSLSWKGFNLSAYFDFVSGNKVLVANNFIDDGYDMTVNTSTLALNYWKKPGDTGVSPKPVAGNPGRYFVNYSTRFLENGSYLRIKDVTLSYTVPEAFLKNVGVLNGVRVYVSALNPYTFHNLDALDPEVGILGNVLAGANSMVKSCIGGVEISF